MRKSQLEFLLEGNEVQEYGKETIFTIKFLPTPSRDKYILKAGKVERSVSASSLLKNYKLIEKEPQTEIAVTEEVVSVKENSERVSRIEGSGIVTSASLADELGITPQDLRRILRRNKIEKPGGGWKWQKDSGELKEIRGVLKGVQEKRMNKKRVRA